MYTNSPAASDSSSPYWEKLNQPLAGILSQRKVGWLGASHLGKWTLA